MRLAANICSDQPGGCNSFDRLMAARKEVLDNLEEDPDFYAEQVVKIEAELIAAEEREAAAAKKRKAAIIAGTA